VAKRVNYLNNKDIMLEIHKSKNSYSSFIDIEYEDYDLILESLDKINIRTIAEAKRNRAKKLSSLNYEAKKEKGQNIKIIDCEVDYRTIKKSDVVFRIITYNHIPDETGRKKNPKTIADQKVKLNFPPFQHWKFDENDQLICVGKSHWIGGMENGYFSKDHGKTTNKLALMWIKLCERYATKGNVRGYSYVDEMQNQAILQLSQIGLQFNEAKSQNPFSYYTSVINNSFLRILNIEKKNQELRDDILEINNLNPSHTRLNNSEWDAAVRRNSE
jgi:hypothetical protein